MLETTQWNTLSDEVWLAILQKLPFKEQVSLGCSCQRLYRISLDKALNNIGKRALLYLTKERPLPHLLSRAIKQLNVSFSIAKSTFLIQEIGKMSYLVTLKVSHIQDGDFKPFMLTVLQLEHLTEIDIPFRFLKYRDEEGKNIVHWATDFSNTKLLTFLFAQSVSQGFTTYWLDINAKDNQGSTPLKEALNKQNQKMSTFLLQNKAIVEEYEITKENYTELFSLIQTDALAYASSLKVQGIPHKDYPPLFEAVGKARSIVQIDLSSQSVNEEVAAWISHALENNPSLRAIDFEPGNLKDKGAQALAKGLALSPSLTHLNLISNGIQAEGAQAIAEALKESRSLDVLKLNRNPLGAAGAVALAENLKASSLSILYCGEAMIGDLGAKSLGQSFHRTLTFLSLPKNQIGDEGAYYLGIGLPHYPALEALDLEDNTIGPKGAQGLARGLAQTRSLKKLALSNNKVGALGARWMGWAIKRNKSLTHLWLNSNQIDDQGACAIAHGLKPNLSLTSLYLGENRIETLGAYKISKMLRVNASLKELYLFSNPIGKLGVLKIAEALKINEALTTLSLYLTYTKGVPHALVYFLGWGFDQDTKNQLEEAIKEKKDFELLI